MGRIIERVYFVFFGLALITHALFLAEQFAPFLPSHGFWGGLAMLSRALAMFGFLGIFSIEASLGLWAYGLPAYWGTLFDVALLLLLAALILWGMRRGWRSKMLIMASIMLPGLIAYFAFGLPGR